jgi:hydrogenase nickel incorporation protein HypA/HybF
VHELSVCQAIVDTVAQHAAGPRVRRVNVRIGYLRQVVPDSLLFAWEVLTDGADLAGCDGCGAVDVALITGEEFQIQSMDVVEEVP